MDDDNVAVVVVDVFWRECVGSKSLLLWLSLLVALSFVGCGIPRLSVYVERLMSPTLCSFDFSFILISLDLVRGCLIRSSGTVETLFELGLFVEFNTLIPFSLRVQL